MEPSDLQERWVPWVNLVGPASRELLEPRETLALLVPREVLDCKDLEESPVNLECQESLDCWDHLAKTGVTERREAQVFLELLDLQDSLDLEDSPA